jgi:hypothetical protein
MHTLGGTNKQSIVADDIILYNIFKASLQSTGDDIAT